MSEHSYTRARVDGVWTIDDGVVSGINAALPGHAFNAKLIGTGVGISASPSLDEQDSATLDATVAAYAAGVDARKLGIRQAERIAEVDARTQELLDMGFLFGGVVCSLANQTQVKMNGLYQARSHPALTYPIAWNSMDDTAVLSIPDAATLEGWYLTALGTVRARLDSGTVLKEAIRAATTIAEVEAIADDRV